MPTFRSAAPRRLVVAAIAATALLTSGLVPVASAQSPDTVLTFELADNPGVTFDGDAAQEPSNATIVVEPAIDLPLSGVVTVSGRGFDPGIYLLVQCKADFESAQDCDPQAFAEPPFAGFARATEDGIIQPIEEIPIDRTINFFQGGSHNCTPLAPCVIAAFGGENGVPVAQAEISFGVPGATVITATPSEDLADEADITLTGVNVNANLVATALCPADLRVVNITDTISCVQLDAGIAVSSDLDFSATLSITSQFVAIDGTQVDCRRESAGCKIVATADVMSLNEQFFEIPITFAARPTGEDLVLLPGVGFTTEGDSGDGQVPIRLNRAADYEVNLNYRLVGFRSDADDDFEDMIGTVTFAPGETEAMVNVAVVDDALPENTEAVLVGFEATSETPGSIQVGGFGFGGLVVLDND